MDKTRAEPDLFPANPALFALMGRVPLCDRGRRHRKAVGMAESGGIMRGKRGLIMGLANNRSIAWGIARACQAQGAELAFTYQGDALKKRVEPLAKELGGIVVGDCDVTNPASLDAAFER